MQFRDDRHAILFFNQHLSPVYNLKSQLLLPSPPPPPLLLLFAVVAVVVELLVAVVWLTYKNVLIRPQGCPNF